MSCQSCTRQGSKESDSPFDTFINCPPRMADGRNFTDYRPRCFQQYIMEDKLMSSFEQRMFLTQNAEDIMKKNAAQAYMTNRCGPCEEPFDVGTMLPENIKQVCNETTCSFNVSNPYGLGLGREFVMSDEDKQFRAQFLAEKEKEQQMFKSQSVAPRDIDPMYFPIDGLTTTSYDRYAVPSGAVPLKGN